MWATRHHFPAASACVHVKANSRVAVDRRPSDVTLEECSRLPVTHVGAFVLLLQFIDATLCLRRPLLECCSDEPSSAPFRASSIYARLVWVLRMPIMLKLSSWGQWASPSFSWEVPDFGVPGKAEAPEPRCNESNNLSGTM